MKSTYEAGRFAGGPPHDRRPSGDVETKARMAVISRVSMSVLTLTLCLVAASSPIWAKARPCGQTTDIKTNCTCDLNTLRPLQGAIGMVQVRDKAAKIAKHPNKERKDLEKDPIKVVRGPDNQLFITDHHHGARAWLMSGETNGICSIEKGPDTTDPNLFWTQLNTMHKVRLADRNGDPIAPGALPKSLMTLPDDPYRTLAWLVREKNGFCRGLMEQKEFAEFIWADWLRKQPDLPASKVASIPRDALPAALKLVESPAAAQLPGYRGNKPSGFTCPKEDD